MSTESVYAATLFSCYAREGEWLLKEPEKHLAPLKLKRQGYLHGWYDRQIEAGMEWEQEIELQMCKDNPALSFMNIPSRNRLKVASRHSPWTKEAKGNSFEQRGGRA